MLHPYKPGATDRVSTLRDNGKTSHMGQADWRAMEAGILSGVRRGVVGVVAANGMDESRDTKLRAYTEGDGEASGLDRVSAPRLRVAGDLQSRRADGGCRR